MTQQQGLLTETDLIKIGNLIDTRLDAKLSDYATKKELTKVISKLPTKEYIDQILDSKLEKKLEEKIGKLPTKDEFTKQMSKLLKAVNDKEDSDKVHKKTHRNLGTDTTILKQQVKHLYTTFNIK